MAMIMPDKTGDQDFTRFMDMVIAEIPMDQYHEIQGSVWEENFTEVELNQLVELYEKNSVLQKFRSISLNLAHQIQLKAEPLIEAALQNAIRKFTGQ